MNLFVYLILFTVLLPTNNAQISHLGLVVDDLSILTRITNAIALQNSANQKTLKVEAFLAEILKVELPVLKSMLNLNTDLLTEKIKSVQYSLAAGLTANYTDSERFEEIAEFMETMIFLDNTTTLGNYSATDLIDLIDKKKGVTYPCDEKILLVVKLFAEAMETDIRRSLKFEYYKKMRASTVEVLECYKSCLTYTEADAGQFYRELSNLHNTHDVYEMLVFHNEHFSFFKDGFSKYASAVSEDIKRTGLLQNATEKLGAKIENLTNVFHRISKTSRAEKLLAGGFPQGPSELKMVAGDVKSRWFKEKVSRGKSTGALEKTIEPFQKFANQVARLQEPWDFLTSLVRSERFELLKENAIEMAESENVPNVTSPNALKKELDTYTKCWQQSSVTDVNRNYLTDYNAHLELPTRILREMKEVVDMTPFVVRSVKKDVLEEFLKQLKEAIPERSTESMVSQQQERIKNIPNYEAVLGVFHSMKELRQAQLAFSVSFGQLVQARNFSNNTFNLTKPVTESRFSKWVECLKNGSFQPETVRHIASFMRNAMFLKNEGNQKLMNMLEKVDQIQKVLEEVEKAAIAMASAKPAVDIQKLRESAGIARHLASGVNVLHEMARVQESANRLRELFQFPGSNVIKTITDNLKGNVKKIQFWKSPETYIERTITGIDTLNTYSKSIRDKELSAIQKLFKEAEKVPGIDMHTDIFSMVPVYLVDLRTDPEVKKAINNSVELLKWDLDFAAKKRNLDAAYLTVYSVSTFFDIVFGFTKEKQTVVSPSGVSHWTTILFCFAFFAFLVLIAFVLYGFSKSGRRKYRNLYLYYFPNQKEFEKRWRYSLFMDRENGQNALIDASREINHINVQNILARGALVNVFSQFGNTPLHMATKRGFAKVVEVLIKNGADRDIVNVRNQKPEELIPQNCSPIEEEKYAAIRKIYEKYRDRNFRIRVPQEFPTHLFHIFIEKRTDDNLTSNFMNKFQGITSDEALPTTTHCICKTTVDGLLETDDVDLLAWIFTGVIMVKESWMTDCLQDEKLIGQDSQYLVEHVRYNGVIHENCVVPWTNYLAKGSMPFLFGVFVVFVMKECPKLANLTLIITTLGGVFLESFPTKETFNLGSHPYLHANLGPAFIIHDNSADLTAYKNDPDRLFTLFTEQEFISFLLQRDIQQDTRQHPIPQLAGTE